MTTKSQITDVLILGAGIAGIATALALKNNTPQIQIHILERNDRYSEEIIIGETLPPQTSQLLKQLGLWEQFQKCNFLPSYGTASSWGEEKLYHNEYIFSPFGYGWHLDRNRFNYMLRKEALAKGIQIHFNTSIVTSTQKKSSWEVNYLSQKKQKLKIESNFVIDASGRKAVFASKLGIHKTKEDELIGFYHFLTQNTEKKYGNGSWVETAPEGWWYSAQLPNDKIVIGYMTDADIAKSEQLYSGKNLLKKLQKTTYTKKRAALETWNNKSKVVAAHTQYLNSIIGTNWLAVGDAASSYDPISSSGIFKSLAMSNFAAYATLDTLNGKYSGLQRYEQIVKTDYENYLKKRKKYYAEEQRYASASFWKRRQVTNTNLNKI